MTTTVTTHSSSVRIAKLGTRTTLATSLDSPSMSHTASVSLPSSPVSVTGMSGLLNSRHLVQDEKLVVATLATLNSGSASNLIKQDLKWIIQSRRKAEGKAELHVEFKKPVKDEQLTSEEVVKRARRRELNRLAARRSREKGQKRKDMLIEEIRKLQSQNSELVNILGDLTEQRNSIVLTLRQHMKQCSDYQATQSAAVGMSKRVLDLLGFHSTLASITSAKREPNLFICTADSSSCNSESQSPSVTIKQESYSLASCPASPVVMSIGSQLVHEQQSTAVPSCAAMYGDISCHITSTFTLPSPQASFSLQPSDINFELPSLVSSLPSKQAGGQALDSSTPASSIDPVLEEEEEQEFVQYKHKLMKHRKQFSESQDITGPGSRSGRLSLERSFSFPCTGRKSNSSTMSTSASSSVELTQSQISSSEFPHLSSSEPTTLDLTSQDDQCSDWLDQVEGMKAESVPGSSHWKQHARPLDTWPPAGMRAAVSSRNPERRFSVADNLPQPFAQPLNLSRKAREKLEHSGHTLPQINSVIGSPSHYSDSKYSGFTVDPYR